MKNVSKILIPLCAVTGNSFALDAKLTSQVKFAEEYSSNLFLTMQPHKEVLGQGGDLALNLILKEENFDSVINANFNNRTYIGGMPGEQLDYNNQLFNMKNGYTIDKLRIGFNAEYNLDTSSSAMDDPEDSVGLVFFRIPKTSRMIQPTLSYDITDATKITIAHKYRETEYDRILNLVAAPFPNTIGNTTTADISYQASKELQLTASYFHKQYDLTHVRETVMPSAGAALLDYPTWAKGITTEYATIGGTYSFPDALKLTLNGGFQSNNELAQGYTVYSNGAVYQQVAPVKDNTFTDYHLARLTKRFTYGNQEYSDIALEQSRSVIPSPSGVLIQYDKYNASLTHVFSPTVLARLSFSYSNRTYPAFFKHGTDVVTTQANVTWKFMPDFELSCNYIYTELKDGSQAARGALDFADSQAAMMNINYTIDGHKEF